MKFFKEFKDFINKGNVVDMAVGVVIATAFGKITSTLVANVIMPLIGVLTGGANVADLAYELSPAVLDEAGEIITPANVLSYGLFIQAIIDFLIIALSVFVFVKVLKSAQNRRKKEEAAAAPAPAPAPSAEETLLTEIRDLLKENNNIKQ